MADENIKQPNVNFGVDPNKTKVLYIDSYVISNNDHVVTFNFAQALPDPSQQNIVSRVALTKAQAKDFLKNLNEHIEKFEV
jgi:predicted alpha/beta hydrolase family esterase